MDIGLIVLRLAAGLTIAAHGVQKLSHLFGGQGLEAAAEAMEGLGFRPGRRFARLAGLSETVGGLLLALGLLTPVAAALVVAVMLVAVLTVHVKNGFFVTSGGYEYNLVLPAGALTLAFAGPGRWSIDALLGLALNGPAWGAFALAGGLLAGALPLLQRQTSPLSHGGAATSEG